MGDLERYNQMYDYLRTVPEPREDVGLLVFGRKDPLVAQTAATAIKRGYAGFVVISGGFGKDSGDLKVPEAVYLHEILRTENPYLEAPVFIETESRNGGENARNSLALMDQQGLRYNTSLTTLAHGTSARRLHETAKHVAIRRKTPIAYLGGIATAYDFQAENPADRDEAAAEILRLADWPAKDWLQPVADLPEDLVDFARDHVTKPT